MYYGRKKITQLYWRSENTHIETSPRGLGKCDQHINFSTKMLPSNLKKSNFDTQLQGSGITLKTHLQP